MVKNIVNPKEMSVKFGETEADTDQLNRVWFWLIHIIMSVNAPRENSIVEHEHG